jgi:iron complex transport system ATP-binding protein
MVTMKISEVCVELQNKPILEKLSLTVQPGILAILGPNGCGKTTLLRSLTGNLKPASGTITLDGKNLTHMKVGEIAKKLTMVSQEHHPVFAYSVRDVVLMGRTPYIRPWSLPTDADREIASQAMRKTGISHLQEREYTELSSGEGKLVHIAMALCQETEIVLLDEPTAFLDIYNALCILDLIQRLAREEQKTIIMALHDVNHALLCADRVLLIFNSRTFMEGDARETINAANLSDLYNVNFEMGQTKSKQMFVVPTMSAIEPKDRS